MEMKRLYHTVFISASKSSCSHEEQVQRTEQLINILECRGFKVSRSCGVTKEWGKELSIEVSGVTTDKQIDYLLAMGNAYQQDAILSVNDLGLGFLLSCKDGSITEYQGVAVVRTKVYGHEDYTIRSDGSVLVF